MSFFFIYYMFTFPFFAEGNGLELSVVNPGFLIGPPLMKIDCTSVEVTRLIICSH